MKTEAIRVARWPLSCILLGLGLLGIAGPQLTEAAAGPAGPRIQFAQPDHDFGRVQAGSIVTNFFDFTNTGDRVLELYDVRSSCGCTAAANYSRRVEPGRHGVVPVIFDSKGQAGPVGKTLWVTCNAPGQSNVLLRISAMLWNPIDVLPQIAAFTFGPDFQTNETRSVRILNHFEEPLSLSPPVCSNHCFRTELKTIQPGKEFELEVTVLPPLGAGGNVGHITLKTSSPRFPVLTVNAYALVTPSLVVTPPRLRLPDNPLTDPAAFTVRIQNRSTNALVLSEPSIDAEGGRAQLRELQPGQLYNLIVTFPAGFKPRPGHRLEARVKSNQPQFPYVQVPVMVPDSSAGDEAPHPKALPPETGRLPTTPANVVSRK